MNSPLGCSVDMCESTHRAASAMTGGRPVSTAMADIEGAACGRICALGLARTKPGRGERTSCMSCSDKLARWHALGIQGALLSLVIVRPIRLSSVVVGTRCSLPALRRAVYTRTLPPRPHSLTPLPESSSAHTPTSPLHTVRLASGVVFKGEATASAGTAFPMKTATEAQASPQELPGEPCIRAHHVRRNPSLEPSQAPKLFDTELPFEHTQSADTSGMRKEKAVGVAAVSGRPCSNALLWHASGGCEVVNGLSGKKLGANKKNPSPKHRAAACKALLLHRFREVCHLLPQNAFAEDEVLKHLDKLDHLSYRSTKALSFAYRDRKAALLQVAPFREWVVAPAACESFTSTA
uniref:tRNA-specific adenosine deaminase 1 n=1 Tax=Haptolina ericina TaxID=156174 RepID=A0A7S3AC70_9EUKA